MKKRDDLSIIKGIRSGDESALYHCIKKYKTYVAYIVGNITGKSFSKSDQEELIADVFITVWEHSESIDEGQSVHFKSYIGAIARNKAKNKLRDTYKHIYDFELDDTIQMKECDVGDTVLEKEMKRILLNCLRQLSRDEQKCFIQYYYYGKPVKVVADELNLKESTVKSKLSRGRNKLKGMLQEEMKDDEDFNI